VCVSSLDLAGFNLSLRNASPKVPGALESEDRKQGLLLCMCPHLVQAGLFFYSLLVLGGLLFNRKVHIQGEVGSSVRESGARPKSGGHPQLLNLFNGEVSSQTVSEPETSCIWDLLVQPAYQFAGLTHGHPPPVM
jgi:hypothetical protein